VYIRMAAMSRNTIDNIMNAEIKEKKKKNLQKMNSVCQVL